MIAENEPISKSVQFISKNCALMLAPLQEELHSKNQLLVPSLDNLSVSQTAS